MISNQLNEDDMDKQWIIGELEEMAVLIGEILSEPEAHEWGEEKNEQFRAARYDIIEYMISNPGALLYMQNSSKLERYKTVVDIIWKTVDLSELEEELYGGRFTDTMMNATGAMARRCKKLRPTFITVKPEAHQEFSVYFKEAMRAWTHGLDNTALILCFTLLENVLKEEVGKVKGDALYELNSPDSPTGVKPVPFGRVIKTAYQENLITYDQKEQVFAIKEKRNNAVHNMAEIEEDDAYDIIIKTKDIIEQVYGKSDK